MKKTLRITLTVLIAITATFGLAGCTTTPFKLKITPMKVEINQPEPKTKVSAPVVTTQRD